MFLAALSLMAALPISAPEPTANIHQIYCTDATDTYQGTGFFIGDGVMVTAAHVVRDARTCTDRTTGKNVKVYKIDKGHDFALLSGSTSESVIKYSCARPKKDNMYTSYGWSSDFPGGDFFDPLPLAAEIKATDLLQSLIPGLYNINPMRLYEGAILHGMSGGPVVDKKGVIVAINNAGTDETTSLFDLADTGLCTGNWD